MEPTSEWQTGDAQEVIEMGRADFAEPLSQTYVECLQRVFGDRPLGNYLELGTGRGYLRRATQEKFPNFPKTYHLDISLRALKKARLYDESGKYLVGNMLQLPTAENSYKGAFSLAAFDTLSPDQLDGALGELRRVLKPGAKVLFVQDAAPHPNSVYIEKEDPELSRQVNEKVMAKYGITSQDWQQGGMPPFLEKILEKIGFTDKERARETVGTVTNFIKEKEGDKKIGENLEKAVAGSVFHVEPLVRFLSRVQFEELTKKMEKEGNSYERIRFPLNVVIAVLNTDCFFELLKLKLEKQGFQDIEEITVTKKFEADKNNLPPNMQSLARLNPEKENSLYFYMGARERTFDQIVFTRNRNHIVAQATARAIIALKVSS